jgi:hypothetical protein
VFDKSVLDVEAAFGLLAAAKLGSYRPIAGEAWGWIDMDRDRPSHGKNCRLTPAFGIGYSCAMLGERENRLSHSHSPQHGPGREKQIAD